MEHFAKLCFKIIYAKWSMYAIVLSFSVGYSKFTTKVEVLILIYHG
jgi:hypothetical protein